MEQIAFCKYQGEGNDFIVLDNRKGAYASLTEEVIRKLCDRRFGIGADGLMFLESHDRLDFTMRYYNADGREGSMCGNGGRCIVAFALRVNAVKALDLVEFAAVDGYHEARVLEDGRVSLKMMDVNSLEVNDDFYFINTGSPHYVEFIDRVEGFNTFEEGRKIRYNERFNAEGTNVNFVEVLGENKLAVMTYERGVEDETLACGTGTVASVLAAAHFAAMKGMPSYTHYQVRVKGGTLEVSFERQGDLFTNIWLTGGAAFVFDGTITLED